ncbi:23S rRNA (guanosine(2251)-2'-O)-methyltransferase RlmB [Stratiformator vulcanicus]|uniref:23S rRNA (Guanosine-2'-O-)-methyltransferase RlmB n=1 Tax=Stratiformator vulcanicus TaxID=2527980 RepID=A0A517R701_9PLAN|nr:RNA methyltransferase [Stratiformator vulcanicus]QDT39659.1 23S rRNA (guanosine-2'-O-)-methyltransferase RlmB [Stratiformator vulcanicus]
MSLTLRNPHSVLAALETRPRDVSAIVLRSGKASGAWGDVVALAEQHAIHVRSEGRGGGLKPRGGPKDSRVGIAEAQLKERTPASLDEVLGHRPDEGYGLWIGIDRVQDPHNVGAIFRTAAFFGVRGVIVTKDQSAPLSPVVYDTACGGMEAMPFAQPTNLARALQLAKENDIWVLGSSEHAEQDVFEVPRDRDWLLILGNEEKGLRRLTAEHCDMMCRLTPRGPVTSLNVSAAASALISALSR